MVNHSNHRIISAINSREITDIQKWLQLYPNLKVVSRDGSAIYRLAIELANPNIIQVSDRFHLIKGLSEAVREEIKNILPRQIVLEEVIVDISKKTGFDWRTVKKYINSENYLTIDNTKRERVNACTPYQDKINELLLNNFKIKNIYLEIQKLGYDGKYGMLKRYISNILKSGKLTYKKILSRKDLVRLLYKPLKDNKKIKRDMLRIVYEKYPLIKNLMELMYEFKNILLKIKSEKALSTWFNKAENINLECINRFIKGCNNDMPAIVNSIKYQYSNGVVEASVEK